MDDQHHAHVKKLCDENCFMPTVYNQAVHLGFYNNVSSEDIFIFEEQMKKTYVIDISIFGRR